MPAPRGYRRLDRSGPGQAGSVQGGSGPGPGVRVLARVAQSGSARPELCARLAAWRSVRRSARAWPSW